MIIYQKENIIYCSCYETSKEEFLREVLNHYEEFDNIAPEKINIEKQTMFYTEEAIPADTFSPLTGLGIVIQDYWVIKL